MRATRFSASRVTKWLTTASAEYVRDDAHGNTVEGYFSVLKRGINGVYHHVSEAH
jgi:hypothetical protein